MPPDRPPALFDPLVDAYDAARPSYPDGLYDALERLVGPLAGAEVVEVGAGTGIATRGLLARGARVTAVDVGPRMLARLLARTPDVRAAVVGDAHALPVRAGAADLVCFAQAWHWVEVARAVPEVVRVLRPGGSLAVWWNDVDAAGSRWHDEQQDRLEAMSPGYRRDYRQVAYGDQLRATGRFAAVEPVRLAWTRRLDVETYLTWLRSKSYVAAIGERLPQFLAAERESMLAAFPDGVVVEPFRVVLEVATTPVTAP